MTRDFDCNRCGQKIFVNDNNVIFDSNRNAPHKEFCKTFPGCVWCPSCQKRFSQKTPCTHYMELGYKIGENEQFFIEKIAKGYKKGQYTAWQNRSKSQYSGTLKNSICEVCKKPLNNLTRLEQDAHLKECRKQTKLF